MNGPGYRHLFGCVWITLLLLGILSAEGLAQTEVPPKRIISLAPSTTEMLFALGLGEKVVGVSRYCDYPPQVASIPKVGGLMDPSYEAIVALKADLVVLLDSHGEAIRELKKLGIATLSVPHQTISDIHHAIVKIGKACGREEEAGAMVEGFNVRTEAVARAVRGNPRPRVLICIGRDTESGVLAGMYVAGRNGFYDEIIELAGGINAYRDEHVAYPQISAEGVLGLNPDVLIDLVSDIEPGGASVKEIAGQWETLRTVAAVRESRLRVVVGRHALRPGPRYVAFLEEVAYVLFPEVFSGKGDG